MDSIRMEGSATLCQALVITGAWVHSASAWFSNNSLTDVRNRYIRMIKMRKRIYIYIQYIYIYGVYIYFFKLHYMWLQSISVHYIL